jgi:two-component system nitrogen regulation response regulator GlnG
MTPERPTVWLVDDDRSIRWVLERALQKAGMVTASFESAEQVIDGLHRRCPDALISDIRMPGVDGLSLLQQVRSRYPALPVIIMTAFADLDRAVAAYRGGAFEYLPKPFDINEAVSIVRRAVTRHPGAAPPAGVQPAPGVSDGIIGAAPAMQEVFRAIGRLARSNMTVLVTGESGTGKELVARALHRHSPRPHAPFIALNTAAIPRELLESELFGHERGAFTGASQQRVGRFEQANGGTLFLDEIGDMPAELQTRLLRVLADGEFYRVGGHVPLQVDVRVIAATHQNLDEQVAAGRFREDLFHRLNVIRLHIPPLRERREDIGALATHFLAAAARELEVEPKTLRADAAAVLAAHAWPGNVRQLENVCRLVTVMAPAREVHLDDLPPDIRRDLSRGPAREEWEAKLGEWARRRLTGGASDLLTDALPTFERVVIEAALRATGGRRQEAARLLGWGRNTLTRKIKDLDLKL